MARSQANSLIFAGAHAFHPAAMRGDLVDPKNCMWYTELVEKMPDSVSFQEKTSWPVVSWPGTGTLVQRLTN